MKFELLARAGQRTGSKASRRYSHRAVLLFVGVDVHAIQIMPRHCNAVVPVDDTVWIQHGDYKKHEVVAQRLGKCLVTA